MRLGSAIALSTIALLAGAVILRPFRPPSAPMSASDGTARRPTVAVVRHADRRRRDGADRRAGIPVVDDHIVVRANAWLREHAR